MTAEELAQRLNARRSGEGWKAKCPAHDDRTPSLSINEGTGGRVLLNCFAGCQPEDIVAALGLTMRDLFPVNETIPRLAALSPLEYDKQRKAGASSLGCKVSTLDSLVEAARPRMDNAKLQGFEVALPDVEPWPEAVDGATVLNEVVNVVSEYLVLPEGTAEAIALWCAHAHAFEAFIHT